MKVEFTKLELVAAWLQASPEDQNAPDLHEKALAGFVLMKNGKYMWSGLYFDHNNKKVTYERKNK